LAGFELTTQRVAEIERSVTAALNAYIDKTRPSPGFWYGVMQSVTGSFIYSLLIVAVVMIIAFGNVELFELVGIEIRTG
jgi:hypothetical protein